MTYATEQLALYRRKGNMKTLMVYYIRLRDRLMPYDCIHTYIQHNNIINCNKPSRYPSGSESIESCPRYPVVCHYCHYYAVVSSPSKSPYFPFLSFCPVLTSCPPNKCMRGRRRLWTSKSLRNIFSLSNKTHCILYSPPCKRLTPCEWHFNTVITHSNTF